MDSISKKKKDATWKLLLTFCYLEIYLRGHYRLNRQNLRPKCTLIHIRWCVQIFCKSNHAVNKSIFLDKKFENMHLVHFMFWCNIFKPSWKNLMKTQDFYNKVGESLYSCFSYKITLCGGNIWIIYKISLREKCTTNQMIVMSIFTMFCDIMLGRSVLSYFKR